MRVSAYRALGATEGEAELYRWRLALNASCTFGFERQHHPAHVDIGSHYDPVSFSGVRLSWLGT